MKNKVSIIMYHYVRNLTNSRYPSIHGLSDVNFRNQIDYLQENFNFVSVEEIIDAISHKKHLPENACLLTFDDGYIDHYTTVFPILNKLGIPAFFSMPGRILKEHKLLDVNKIHHIIANSDEAELLKVFESKLVKYIEQFNLPQIEYYKAKIDCSSRFDSPGIIFLKRMLQYELPEKVRNLLTDDIYKELVDVPESVLVNELYMTRDQMLLMKRTGMTFGIHGYEHAWMNHMNEEEFENDLIRALDAMSGIVDKSGWVMCYPYGSYSKEAAAIARKYGAAIGLSTIVGEADLNVDNIYCLPRFDTNDFPPKSLRYKEYRRP